MGVVNSSWFDRVLLSIPYMFRTLMLTDVQAPFLGTPVVPLNPPIRISRFSVPRGPGRGKPWRERVQQEGVPLNFQGGSKCHNPDYLGFSFDKTCFSEIIVGEIIVKSPCVYICIYIHTYRQWVLRYARLKGSGGTYSPVVRRIGSDAGGLGFESQTGRVRGRSIPSLWRDRRPAIKGLRPSEHHAGQIHPDHQYVCI